MFHWGGGVSLWHYTSGILTNTRRLLVARFSHVVKDQGRRTLPLKDALVRALTESVTINRVLEYVLRAAPVRNGSTRVLKTCTIKV